MKVVLNGCIKIALDVHIHMWRMWKFLLLILFFTLCKCETFIVDNNMQSVVTVCNNDDDSIIINVHYFLKLCYT